jgi:periplasmic protein TonB
MDHHKIIHMKKKSGGKVVLLAISFFIASFSMSCNNDESSETTTTDTTSIMKMDTNTPVVTDTMGQTSETAMKSTATMGKPNPAKKGKKGKVTVVASSASSDTKMERDASGVYSSVEVMPAYPGGSAALQTYFNENLIYPADASTEGVEGTVNITFNVDEKGNLTDIQPVGEKLGYGLEEEAVRVIKKMPDWTPGKLKGENVKTKFMLPVRFELE